MVRTAVAVIGALAACAIAACAKAPDGLLVITGEPGEALDSEQSATLDIFLGVDRGVPAVELTETRPFVVDALPDDLDRTWDDPSQPYKIMLQPSGAEVYVVMRGAQVGRRFGANLGSPVTYPGDGLVSTIADLYRGGEHGVCPHGTAEDVGYEVEILPVDPGDAPFDCDQDGVLYPQDCADYDETLRPSLAYPAGISLPDELMCCNDDARGPAEMVTTSSGPGNCSIGFTCSNAVPFVPLHLVDWVVPSAGSLTMCECVAGHDPLDCIAGAHVPLVVPDVLAPQPYCDVAIEDDGEVCPDQVVSIRDRFRDFFPATPLRCPVAVWWQEGPVGIAFRSQGASVETTSTDDCDADVVFVPVGPPPGPITPEVPAFAIGWYIIEVTEAANPSNKRLVPMHVHPAPIVGCDQPLECGFE
jgi:hypothetical protein